MNSTKTPILILLLILLFLLINCNGKSQILEQLGSIVPMSGIQSASVNSWTNEEVVNSTFKPSNNEVVRTNVFCNKCKQDGFEFNCSECAPHIPENLSKFYYRYLKAQREMKHYDSRYTNGEYDELTFHKKFREWLDKYSDLTLLPANKIRQNEILNDLDIFDIDETHKILVGKNELKKNIPLKTIDKIIRYETANYNNNNRFANNNDIFANSNEMLANNNDSFGNNNEILLNNNFKNLNEEINKISIKNL